MIALENLQFKLGNLGDEIESLVNRQVNRATQQVENSGKGSQGGYQNQQQGYGGQGSQGYGGQSNGHGGQAPNQGGGYGGYGQAGNGEGFVSNVINFNPFLSQSIGDIHINGGAVSVPDLLTQNVPATAVTQKTAAPAPATTKAATTATTPVATTTEKATTTTKSTTTTTTTATTSTTTGLSTPDANSQTCGVCKLRHSRNKLCSDISHHVRMVRSTACEECFAIKASYRFGHVGANDFDPDDYLTLIFTEPVELVGWTAPLSNVYKTDVYGQNKPRYEYRACFDLESTWTTHMEFKAGKIINYNFSLFRTVMRTLVIDTIISKLFFRFSTTWKNARFSLW